jgi:nitroreductase
MPATEPRYRPLAEYVERTTDDMTARARAFYQEMRGRRTVRHFARRPVPPEVIEYCLRTAGTAPSGANMQPWHFAVVTNPEKKSQIRHAAEVEEREFYERRAPQAWLEALAPLGTDWRKPFLEDAPCLIAVFVQPYRVADDGRRIQNYYATESVGLATGFLIAALHHAGLATLTHTPSPMGFLNELLDRPPHERPFVLLVVGFPAEGAQVPDITKLELGEIASFHA